MKAVFDIGGTNLRAATSKDGKTLDGFVRRPTPRTKEEGFKLLQKLITESSEGSPVSALAGGVAGVVRGTTLVRSPNLPLWEGADFGEMFPDVPLKVMNDAAAGCVGEALRGAGAGKRIVAYIAIGTGIGGAKAVGGTLEAVHDGFEPGKQIIDVANGRTFEDVVSGKAIVKRYGKKASELSSDELHEVAKVLAVGIYNSIVHWSPEIFVLGGAVILEVPALLPLIRVHLEKTLTIFSAPPIEMAQLGEKSVLYGALQDLVKDS